MVFLAQNVARPPPPCRPREQTRLAAPAADTTSHHAQLVPSRGFGSAAGYGSRYLRVSCYGMFISCITSISHPPLCMEKLSTYSAPRLPSCLATVHLLVHSLASYHSHRRIPQPHPPFPVVRPAITPNLNQFHRTPGC